MALGITTDGVKIPLGLWEGSTNPIESMASAGAAAMLAVWRHGLALDEAVEEAGVATREWGTPRTPTDEVLATLAAEVVRARENADRQGAEALQAEGSVVPEYRGVSEIRNEGRTHA